MYLVCVVSTRLDLRLVRLLLINLPLLHLSVHSRLPDLRFQALLYLDAERHSADAHSVRLRVELL